MMNMFAAGPNDSYMASNAAQPNLVIDFKELTTIVLSVAGPIFFMCMQISSLQTARMIFVTKRVGDLSSFPFLSLITNGTVWFIYGSVKTDWTILIPNFTAVVVGGICTTVFQINSKDDIPRSFYAFSMIVILPALVFGFRGDSISLGLMGVFVSILLMGSPLSTVTTVLKEKKTDSMPFETSFTAFLNSLSWSLYGYLIVDDLMLWLPAVIGLLLATFQLTLFIFFGFPSPTPRQDSLPQSFVSIQVMNAV
jgi:solute carrier family 50 (sugar transporter)